MKILEYDTKPYTVNGDLLGYITLDEVNFFDLEKLINSLNDKPNYTKYMTWDGGIEYEPREKTFFIKIVAPNNLTQSMNIGYVKALSSAYNWYEGILSFCLLDKNELQGPIGENTYFSMELHSHNKVQCILSPENEGELQGIVLTLSSLDNYNTKCTSENDFYSANDLLEDNGYDTIEDMYGID